MIACIPEEARDTLHEQDVQLPILMRRSLRVDRRRRGWIDPLAVQAILSMRASEGRCSSPSLSLSTNSAAPGEDLARLGVAERRYADDDVVAVK